MTLQQLQYELQRIGIQSRQDTARTTILICTRNGKTCEQKISNSPDQLRRALNAVRRFFGM